MKAIIYYRKSTDRDDKQANSLEHQLNNCRNTAERFWLEVHTEFWESRSAKTEFTREKFNEMITLCKKGKIDYIIADEPKRLSRNNIDTSRIIDLMDKKQIRGVICTSREYHWDNSRDKFLLQLDLSLSKMDNEDRAKDVKEKMNTCIENTGRFLGKAPFGYKNITIKKWHKEIVVDKREAEIVREVYNLRIENKAYSTIAQILEDKYGDTLSISYTAQRIQKLVQKEFYYGVFTWNGKKIQGSHKPIISKELYDRANEVAQWVYQKRDSENKRKRAYRKYPLKWLVRDVSWIYLTSYTKKGIVYYGNQYRSTERVSINETKLFNAIGEYIKVNEGRDEILSSIDRDLILDLLKKNEVNNGSDFVRIDEDIERLKWRQDKLLDMQLDGNISNEKYLEKNNQMENEIKVLRDKKESLKDNDFTQKTQIMLELAGSFYRSYFRANEEGRIEIIKMLMLELFVTNKKELQIEESPIFQSSKMLNLFFGTPTENRTPVPGMRILCPNH